MIIQIEEKTEKREIARYILEKLPDWFGIEASREEYITESEQQIFLVAQDNRMSTGFLCLKETGQDTLEIAVMGVLPECHR